MKNRLFLFIFFATCFISCSVSTGDLGTGNNADIKSSQYFWGEWTRMDNGKAFIVGETSVTYNSKSYTFSASSDTELSVEKLGTFTKQSDSVMVCDSIPYFRNGGTNLEYQLKVVGFTNDTGTYENVSSRAIASSSLSGIKAKGKSKSFTSYEKEAESDENGIIKLTAPTTNDNQTVTVSDGDAEITVTDLQIKNSGDYMGTIVMAKAGQYNLKITGTISDDQKDDGYLYGNNAKTYSMKISIKNISENKCSTSVCTIASADSNLVLSSDDVNLSNFVVSSLAGGATKNITLTLSYGTLSLPYIDTGINISIENPLSGTEWTDYIPLRFFKGTIPISISAKSTEQNSNAALNGFIIYPDGNNQFFAIPDNSSKAVFVPTFGNESPYKLVFSGATVTSNLSDSTEMFYTVNPCSLSPKTVITSSTVKGELASIISFGGQNHDESKAYEVNNEFESYLSDGEIDYYSIKADSDTYYAPNVGNWYLVDYVNEKGTTPSSIILGEGTTLSSLQLPELTAEGYTFLGWYSGSSKVNAESYKITSDLTLTAKWEAVSYTISYILNGGTAVNNPSSYNIESSAITLLSPSKTGFAFEGWYSNEDCTQGKRESVEKGTTGDLTLYAKWVAISYTISYELNGGENSSENPASYTVESEIAFVEPVREDYAFGGWFESSNFSGSKVTGITKNTIGNKTLYARWLSRCKVTYTTEYGTAPDEIIVGETDALTADQLPELSYDGYFFNGWYAGTTLVYEGYVVNGDITLSAKWSEKCMITYISEHGIVPESVFLAKDSILTAERLPFLTEDGWNFNGWYNGETKVEAGMPVTENMTFTANWEVKIDNFIYVEGGTFSMGSTDSFCGNELPVHTVTVSSFYMSPYELTQGEYEKYCTYSDSKPSSVYGDGNDYPVYYVSWYNALVYCNKLSVAQGLSPCYTINGYTDPLKWGTVPTGSGSEWDSVICDFTANGYRLPTEAEWEYAARGGKNNDNYIYSGSDNADDVAWFANTSSSQTHKKGTKTANSLGIYDMSGNVNEWCWDWYGSYSSSNATNPIGATSGILRVYRGGDCGITAEMKIYTRGSMNPYFASYNRGFRLVRSSSSIF